MPRACENCKTPTDRRCAGCSKAWYCGKRCQESQWWFHLLDCKPKDKITTAERLNVACIRRIVPSHGQTREDYGFARAGGLNQIRLLDLYIELLMYTKPKVTPRLLHSWMSKGTLAREIIARDQFELSPLPPEMRGRSRVWFLENQWMLDRNCEAFEKGVVDEADTSWKAGWLYSGGRPNLTTEKIKEICNTWPEEERSCLFFCGMSVDEVYPGPLFYKLWLDLGFCTCNEVDEVHLGRLYTRIVRKSTFQEFLSAYKSSGIAALFRTKGFDREFSKFKDLEPLLSLSPNRHFPVWDLKWFIISKIEDFEICPSVFSDYGFTNCKTKENRDDLKSVYEIYFNKLDARPTDLHQACIEGKLFEFLNATVAFTNKKKYRKLLKNMYTLPSTAK